MSTLQEPEVAVVVTSGATTEVKRFMEAEGVSPDVGGLRVSVQPGGCSGFKYGLLDRGRSRRKTTSSSSRTAGACSSIRSRPST